MSEVEKALTDKEWENPGEAFDGYVDLYTGTVDVRIGGPGGVRDEERERRALAALLLRGHFSWGDVDLLHSVRCFEGGWNEDGERDYETERRLTDLADRIEALLPPRGMDG